MRRTRAAACGSTTTRSCSRRTTSPACAGWRRPAARRPRPATPGSGRTQLSLADATARRGHGALHQVERRRVGAGANRRRAPGEPPTDGGRRVGRRLRALRRRRRPWLSGVRAARRTAGGAVRRRDGAHHRAGRADERRGDHQSFRRRSLRHLGHRARWPTSRAPPWRSIATWSGWRSTAPRRRRSPCGRPAASSPCRPMARESLRTNSSGASRHIWIDDLSRQSTTQVTTTGEHFMPQWSRDGRSLIFGRGYRPANSVQARPADGRGSAADDRVRPALADRRLDGRDPRATRRSPPGTAATCG